MIINNDIKTVFGDKYYEQICSYIELIQKVINKYDMVIFMARKAYCFYKALKKQGLINAKDCIIRSSRAVTYLDTDFEGKNIAIIEDVVILGESLSEVIQEGGLEFFNPDIYMLACSQEFFNKANRINKDYYACCIYEKTELLELATLITNFIVYSMVPYNSDFPQFSWKDMKSSDIELVINDEHFIDISDFVNCNKENVIQGAFVFYDNSLLNGNSILTIKVRVYIDKETKVGYFVPIVFFSEINKNDLDWIWQQLFTNKSGSFVFLKNKGIEAKNKYKIVIYKLSEHLMKWLITKKDFSGIKKVNIEGELFNNRLPETVISEQLFNPKSLTICDLKNKLYDSLAYAYDVIIENFSYSSKLYEEFNSNYISLIDIEEKVSIVDNREPNTRIVSSIILDVLIDNGVVVPRTVIKNDDSINRIFKFGEVANLTEYDFRMFAMVLSEYSKCFNRGLDKTELEKISVLFFRFFNRNFDVNKNMSEAYRICYSKFGPRISNSKTQYAVTVGSTLFEKLAENHLLDRTGDNKIEIIDPFQNEELNKVRPHERYLFADQLFKLYTYYNKFKANDPNNTIFNYINTYIRLLTLLSIGNEEKDKILSLLAEVNLVKGIKKYWGNNIEYFFKRFDGIIDGILSGVWKYFCYKKQDLLPELFNGMFLHAEEENVLYVMGKYLELINGKISNDNCFDELGEYLFEVCIFYIYLCDVFEHRKHADFSSSLYRYFLSNNFLNVKEYYRKALNIQDKNDFIQENLRRIDIKASNIIDKYIMLGDNLKNHYDCYDKCLVIFKINGEELPHLSFNDFHAYRFNNYYLIPIDQNNENFVLSTVCASLNDDHIRFMLYYSHDKNMLFYATTTALYGSVFLDEINRYIRNIVDNKYLLSNKEFICVSNESHRYYPHNDISIEYFKSKNIEEQLSLYWYRFQKKRKNTNEKGVINMNIENAEFNNSQMIVFESLDLKEANFQQLINNSGNAETAEKVVEAKEAYYKKNKTNFNKCMNWLWKNSTDLIVKFGSSLLIEYIKSL